MKKPGQSIGGIWSYIRLSRQADEAKRSAWAEFSKEWPEFTRDFPARSYQYFCIEYACREMFGTPWLPDSDASSTRWRETLASLGISSDDEILKEFTEFAWEKGRNNKLVTKDEYMVSRER